MLYSQSTEHHKKTKFIHSFRDSSSVTVVESRQEKLNMLLGHHGALQRAGIILCLKFVRGHVGNHRENLIIL